MNTALVSKRKLRDFALRYQVALQHYLRQGAPTRLQPALKLGRQAVALGLETLDLALIHEQVLLACALPIETPANRKKIVRLAGLFFARAIIPMEETHRTAREANVRLSR